MSLGVPGKSPLMPYIHPDANPDVRCLGIPLRFGVWMSRGVKPKIGVSADICQLPSSKLT